MNQSPIAHQTRSRCNHPPKLRERFDNSWSWYWERGIWCWLNLRIPFTFCNDVILHYFVQLFTPNYHGQLAMCKHAIWTSIREHYSHYTDPFWVYYCKYTWLFNCAVIMVAIYLNTIATQVTLIMTLYIVGNVMGGGGWFATPILNLLLGYFKL